MTLLYTYLIRSSHKIYLSLIIGFYIASAGLHVVLVQPQQIILATSVKIIMVKGELTCKSNKYVRSKWKGPLKACSVPSGEARPTAKEYGR